MKKVIVFGGNGFIGGHVVDNLLDKGFEVTVFARHDFDRDNIMAPHKGYRFFLGDIKDREAVLHAVSKHDGAINLSGILGTSETVDNPYPSVAVNIMGGLNFLQAVREYKIKAVQITVGNHFMNNSYSITKTTVERFALMFNKEHNTQIAIVRGLNAYGERQKHAPVRKITPNFIIPALKGEKIRVNGNGKQIMDMIYVKDLAEILVRALIFDHGVYDKVFEAGTGHKTTVNDIANTINKLTNNKAGIEHVPMRAGEPEDSVVLGNPDTLKPLRIERNKLMDIERGLDKTIFWYKNYYEWEKAV